ncbi:MAG: CHC2 zinc finger domain-containing protein, partial [Smithellaceae bacterium]|nr:CHC2 zinc finger domain-containing protein [Smithellaceae bacterium]
MNLDLQGDYLGGLIPDDKIEEIRNRTDIAAIVSEYLTLRKAGRNLLGLCPFHQEKTPSFTVSPDKQIFFCFGCGAGGNVFAFLMKISGMSYPESIRYLAGKTGVVIPDADRAGGHNQRAGIREQIIRINQLAAEYFSTNLYSDDGKSAREYLKQRGIEDETARRFSLGYASAGWTGLRDFFRRKGTSLEMVSQAGLIIP